MEEGRDWGKMEEGSERWKARGKRGNGKEGYGKDTGEGCEMWRGQGGEGGWNIGYEGEANILTVWDAAAIDDQNQREEKIAEQMKLVDEIRRRKEEIRKDGVSGVPGGSL